MVNVEEKSEGIMGNEQWIGELVQRVLYAIAQRQITTDDYAVTVFTGATAGLKEALTGLESLMLSGLSMKIVLSESARHLYGNVVDERLLPWPGASMMEPGNWFTEIQAAKGILVPMLSVNALSKASGLMADSLTGNIILQALFMGKPLIAAIDGAAPGGADRRALGLDKGSAGLQRAVAERLIQFSDLGGSLSWSSQLGIVGQRILLNDYEAKQNVQKTPVISLGEQSAQSLTPKVVKNVFREVSVPLRVSVVDAATVRKANRDGVAIQAMAGAVFTPLAKELAQQYGTRVDVY
ncbi:hypothetical protein [Desulforhopalus sp. 52FAK]